MEYRQNFRALEAFEAVSRHLSVSAAAAEMGVTQSAISHQLRLLSDLVGERLVQKQGRGVALTEAGDRLARKLQPAFAEIVRSVGDAIGGTRNVVRLAICSSFGPAWLVPRLAGFYAAKPAFDLHLCMYARDPELTDAVADAFVTTLPTEKGFQAVLLWAEKLIPVVSSRRAGAALPALITTDLQPGRQGADWKAYAALSGQDTLADGPWLYASHYLIALEMVRAGLALRSCRTSSQRGIWNQALCDCCITRLFRRTRTTISASRKAGAANRRSMHWSGGSKHNCHGSPKPMETAPWRPSSPLQRSMNSARGEP